MTAPRAAALEAIGLSKRFPSVVALDDVSLRVAPGSFHALLGENGAGKSTLVKCIMGYYRPDSGSVLFDDREIAAASPLDAHALGIGMVYQHFTLVPGMSVLENFAISAPNLDRVVDWKALRAQIEAFLATMPFRVPLDASAAGLAAGEKQKVEILRQIFLDRRFLILDEPTSVLTPGEADEVLGLLRRMTRESRISVLMITHKFREVAAFADSVTVLRRGRLVGTGAVKDLDVAALTEMTFGSREAPRAERGKAARSPAPMLEVQGLAAANDAGHPAIGGLDLALHGGEILGIAGVSGNGQRELVEVLAGQRAASAGAVRVHGKPYRARRREQLRHKVACLPEEPLRNACVRTMSVADNLAFRVFDQPPYAFRHAWLNRARIRWHGAGLIEKFRVKASSPAVPVATLSGGNVQRVVLAREVGDEVELLVVANPCFGLDMASIAEIRARIMAARNRGAAILLVSEDLDEILELSDRIAVMSRGKLVYSTDAAHADIAVIGRHMAGHG
jgi:simple sugar transport system ATP-binding protein